ncbi:hypothetical protein CHUAL_004727 [Chamberlinius hualienensis]
MIRKNILRGLFSLKKKPTIIGMIHVRPLPGTPNYNNESVDEIVTVACKEAEIYKNNKVDAILIENMHDLPYVLNENVGPEIVAGMTRVATEIKRTVGKQVKCGIQILAAANVHALAVAHSTGCDFIRAEGFVFSHVADEGLINSCAGQLLRYRKSIGAENIAILTDIKKKHSSHAITGDISEVETAKAAEFFLSDGVIVTGSSTGHAPQPDAVRAVQNSVTIPVVVGSGVTLENVHQYASCEGLIIGSYFKENRKWSMPLDEPKIAEFMEKINLIRNI